MKKLLCIIIAFVPFIVIPAQPPKKKIAVSEREMQLIIEGMRKSRMEGWQANEVIDTLIARYNRAPIDSSKNK